MNNELKHSHVGDGPTARPNREKIRFNESALLTWLRGLGQPASVVWSALACSVLAMLFAGCASPSSDTASLPGNMPGTGETTSKFNAMREGDVIQITFEGSTNLNTTAKIALDGVISMPLIGKVKAVGKTPLEFEAVLTGLYESQIKPSEISVVIVAQVAVVYVYGAVLKPGKIPLDRPMTILDAVMEAGGVDHGRASLSSATLLRMEDGRRRSYKVNLKRALNGQEEFLPNLQPFDIIHIPERAFNF